MIRSNVDMMEALRLTRQGRLGEAMAVLRGAAPAGEGVARRQAKGSGASVVDMVPPSGETGSAWTAPPTGAALPSIPAGLLDRLPKFGAAVDLHGVAGRTMKRSKVAPPAGATFEDYSFTNEGAAGIQALRAERLQRPVLPLVVMRLVAPSP
jgi:hypothetical protein